MQPAASPEDGKPFRAAHPLAIALIDRLKPASGSRVLDFAAGSGRNSAALERAGLTVVRIDDATAASASPFAAIEGPFAAAISTHGLLHGRLVTIATNIAALAELLRAGGVLYATFGSVHDARFGRGERLDGTTYAPLDGDEAGVPHTFFDRDDITALLRPQFVIESLEEAAAGNSAGKWAHREAPLTGAVHWFAVATAPSATE